MKTREVVAPAACETGASLPLFPGSIEEKFGLIADALRFKFGEPLEMLGGTDTHQHSVGRQDIISLETRGR